MSFALCDHFSLVALKMANQSNWLWIVNVESMARWMVYDAIYDFNGAGWLRYCRISIATMSNGKEKEREKDHENWIMTIIGTQRNARWFRRLAFLFFFLFSFFFFFFFKLFSYFGLRVLFCLSCLSLLLATAEPSGHFGVFGHGGGSGYGIGGFRRGVVLVAVAPERDPRRLAADHVAGCGGWGTGRLLLLLLLLVAVGDFEFLAVVARFPRRQHRIRAGDLARAP